MDATTRADDEPEVLAQVEGRLGVLTLNRPAALNALSLIMVRQLAQALQKWRSDPDIDAIVLRGAGDKALCAGGDIRAIYDSCKAGNQDYLTFFAEEYRLVQEIHRYCKPTIALMDGYVMGGGMGLSQACSLRVVTERSRLAMPEVSIGYFPDVGGSCFLSRLPGAIGNYLGLTGVQLNANDALYCGLADVLVPAAQMAELVSKLAAMPEATLSVRATIIDWLNDLPAPPDSSPSQLEQIRPAIDLHFSQSSVGAIMDSLGTERGPDFTQWAQQTQSTMASRSPLAMSVTLEQLKRGAAMTLEQCLEMEFHLDQEWLPRGDMIEGVRALIVDKDKKPVWRPSSVKQVTVEQVQSFFVRMPGHQQLTFSAEIENRSCV